MKKLEKTNNKINLLLYADLKIGMQVMDEDGDIGIIKECLVLIKPIVISLSRSKAVVHVL